MVIANLNIIIIKSEKFEQDVDSYSLKRNVEIQNLRRVGRSAFESEEMHENSYGRLMRCQKG